MEKMESEQPISWLERLRKESWEAELLISTVAVFGTLQLFNVTEWVTHFFIDVLPPNQYNIGYFITFFGLLGVSMLTSMFVIHFILRAYWVGLIGLNSVFPDYETDSTTYSKIYMEKTVASLPKIDKTIEQVDELCSVIFSGAFSLLLTYVYMALQTSVLLFVYNCLLDYISDNVLFYFIFAPMLVLLLAWMIFVGYANTKTNKSHEPTQLLLAKFSRIMGFVLLGPLFPYIGQINMLAIPGLKKKKGMSYLLMLFLIVGIFISVYMIFTSKITYLINPEAYSRKQAFNEYYASEIDKDVFLVNPQISADIISKPVMKLFIPIHKYERTALKRLCEQPKDLTKQEGKSWYLEQYQSYHDIFLDGKRVVLPLIKYELPRTKQFGVLAYIHLDGKETGAHTIKVVKNFSERTASWEIPFQYISQTN